MKHETCIVEFLLDQQPGPAGVLEGKVFDTFITWAVLFFCFLLKLIIVVVIIVKRRKF